MEESTWIGLERAVVAASLGEITPIEASDRMCAALSADLGVVASCSLGGAPLPPSASVRLEVGTMPDGAAILLDLPGHLGVDDRDRIKKLFELVVQLAHPFSKAAQGLHQLRNRLAGLLANVEYVEMTMTDAEDGTDESPEQRDDIITALNHAAASCREMGKALRGLSGL
jgi:hypothetical protein